MDENRIVLPGFKVDIELIDEQGNREAMTCQIVPDESADLTRGFLGESTPLCRAIYGKTVGTTVDYQMGELRAVKIISLEPSDESPDPEIARQREAKRKKAVDDAERTNQILFASSFNGKWGDYDPSGLMEPEEQ